MTIEERAKAYADERNFTGVEKSYLWKQCYKTYINIATEQKAIDDAEKQTIVDRACEYLHNFLTPIHQVKCGSYLTQYKMMDEDMWKEFESCFRRMMEE